MNVRRTAWLAVVGFFLMSISPSLGIQEGSYGEGETEARALAKNAGVRIDGKTAGSPTSSPGGEGNEPRSKALGKHLEAQLEGIENPRLIALLLDWYGKIASGVPSFFFEAARGGNSRRMDALLSHNPDLVHATDSLGRTGLHWAALGGNVNEVKMILACGGVPNLKDNEGKTPSDLAIENGHKEIVPLLMRGRIPIQNDSEARKTDVVGNLLPEAKSQERRVEEKPLQPAKALRMAVIAGEVEKVESILDRDPDLINSIDAKIRWTPLHWAVERTRCEVVRLLLSRGAEVDVRDIHGWTPLALARRNGNQKMMDLLAGCGAKD